MASGHNGSSGEGKKEVRASSSTRPSRAVNATAYAWGRSQEASRLAVYAAFVQDARSPSSSILLPNAAVTSGTPFDAHGLQIRGGHASPPSSCLGPSPLLSSPSGGYHCVVSGISPVAKRPLEVDDDPQEDPSNKKLKTLAYARDPVAPCHSCQNEDLDDQFFDYHYQTGSSSTVALSLAPVLAPQPRASITEPGKRPCEDELQKDASNKKMMVLAGDVIWPFRTYNVANSLESILTASQMEPAIWEFLCLFRDGLQNQNEHILAGTSSAAPAPAPGATNLSSSGAQDGVPFQREVDEFLLSRSLQLVDVNVLAERIEDFDDMWQPYMGGATGSEANQPQDN